GGRGQVVAEAAHQLAVAVDGLLVVEDEGGVGGQVAGDGAAEGGVRGRALEAELGDEAGRVGGVVAVVLPVPHVPDVDGAGGLVLRRVGGVGGEGTAGDVRPRRVELGHDGRQQLAVEGGTPAPAFQLVLPAPVGVPLQVLVVAAPQHQAGM